MNCTGMNCARDPACPDCHCPGHPAQDIDTPILTPQQAFEWTDFAIALALGLLAVCLISPFLV